jgi:hypothetical protein
LSIKKLLKQIADNEILEDSGKKAKLVILGGLRKFLVDQISNPRIFN